MNVRLQSISVRKNAEMLRTYPFSKLHILNLLNSYYTNPNLPSPNAFLFSSGLK